MRATPDDPRTDGETCARRQNGGLSEQEREARARDVARRNTPDQCARDALCARLDAQVPALLKLTPNWVLWRYELREDGTLKKPPTAPRRALPARSRRVWTAGAPDTVPILI